MSTEIRELFAKGKGVFQLFPSWVPRNFNEPGKRLRLHPDDYFAFGMDRGGICERWLGSVTRALNGPKTEEFEGMSFAIDPDEPTKKVLLKDIVEELGSELIGEELYEKYGTWPTFAKLFDYDKPLFHHLHPTEEKANRIGMHGKPEAYYFPAQYNQYLGKFPLTYFGFDPSTKKEDVLDAIRDYNKRDTRITEFSRAYRIKLNTGWYTAPGVIHAPASVLTYEPQWNSDVNAVYENVTAGEVNTFASLTASQPEAEKGDIDQLFDLIDWEESTRIDYKDKYFREPLLRKEDDNYAEHWVAYDNDWIAAKRIIIKPGQSAVVHDVAAYCALVIQGHGTFAGFACEAPGLLRVDEPSGDEFFVSEDAAKSGIKITNNSRYEPLEVLQNFANNSDAP